MPERAGILLTPPCGTMKLQQVPSPCQIAMLPGHFCLFHQYCFFFLSQNVLIVSLSILGPWTDPLLKSNGFANVFSLILFVLKFHWQLRLDTNWGFPSCMHSVGIAGVHLQVQFCNVHLQHIISFYLLTGSYISSLVPAVHWQFPDVVPVTGCSGLPF